jgi:integrase|tara:strand:- start:820 stop:1950 length:1131 start_codon:yes stop_codon:yes gene_type:complete
MPSKLSYQFVRSQRAGDKDIVVRDTELKGFMLRVRPNGKKTFAVEIARNRRITIGDANLLTPQEARDRASEELRKFKYGLRPGNSKVPTLRGFVDKRYAEVARFEQKEGDANLKRLFYCFESFLDTRLDRISIADIQAWRAQRLSKGIAKSTVNRDTTSLKSVLNKAVEWKMIGENPISGVKPLRVDKQGRVRYLSTDEETRLREALGHVDCRAPYLQPMVLVAMNSGLRRGELLNLKWGDVDLDRKTIVVRGSGAKNSQTRYVNANEEVIQVLRNWRGNAKKNNYVFGNPNNGGQLGHFKRSWATVKEKAEVEDFRFHDLRHHFCSKLAMAGVDLNTIRELAGHSDFQMTLRYAHLSADHKQAAVEQLVEGRSSQ